MKETIEAIYVMLDTDIELQDIYTEGLPIYFLNRPQTRPPAAPKFPYLIASFETNHNSLVINTITMTIDIYDRDDISENLIMAAERVKKMFERARITAPNDMAYGESTIAVESFIEEEDRRVWHWSADFNIRADKKTVIC